VSEFWKGESETMDPEERDARNLERLRRHLEAVRSTSAFYRQRLADVDVDALTSREALAEVPTVSKTDIIEDQRQQPPYGSLIGCDPEEVVRLYIGPGPQTTFFTRDDYAATADNAAWVFASNGFRPGDVVDVTIMYHWVIAGTIMDEGYRLVGCATIPGGIGNPKLHLENARWAGTTGLFAFPTFLEELANAAREMDLDPARDLRLRVCTIAGEMHSADHRARMEEFWGGMAVRELYGGAEVPFVAAECELGRGMHLNPDFVVELVHPETKQPVGPGEPGVIVVSDLQRRAYPMIRYFSGDLSEGLDPDPCPCGRTTPRLGRILGRVGDIPRVKGLFVVPKQVAASLARFEDLGAFQLVVDRPGTQDRLTVRIEHAGDPAARPALVPQVVAALKDGIRLTCEVELVDAGALEGQPTVDDRREL